MKQVFTGTYSWSRSHWSIVLLVALLAFWVDVMVRRVPRSFLNDETFWTAVAAWTAVLLLGFYVSHYRRIRYSIRLAVVLGLVTLALVFAFAAFVLGLSGWYWPPIIGLYTGIIIAQVHTVFQDRRRSNALPLTTLVPEEQEIVETARELCRSLQLFQRFDPLYITWTDDVFSDEISFEDGFQRRNLLLPLPLKNTLSSEEWKLLVAAYFVEQKTGLQKLPLEIAKSFLPLIIYAVVFTRIVRFIAENPYAISASWIGFAGIAVFSMKLFMTEGKKHALAVDLKAARLVGKEISLDVLRKINSLNLPDMEPLGRKRGVLARFLRLFKPSLQERIDNLSS